MQHVLLKFLQSCKKSIYHKGLAGTVFVDLSKPKETFKWLKTVCIEFLQL